MDEIRRMGNGHQGGAEAVFVWERRWLNRTERLP